MFWVFILFIDGNGGEVGCIFFGEEVLLVDDEELFVDVNLGVLCYEVVVFGVCLVWFGVWLLDG